ncbi:MAG TPA: Sua5/YciO/YrdC/YwlC family protein, partial [Pseudonocardiaceae bacterium]|nr:Sua5/YciO/YrdC/YwlC family protein [Pseudonocardiaceae bacterium]
MGGRVRREIHVDGIVQGVGFRPFVHDLATRLGLAGLVGNDVAGVFVQVEGGADAVAEFLVALRRDAPPLADIERVTVTELAPTGAAGFTIAASRPGGTHRVLVSADSATCADCLRELFDPADRRYRYPFVNCTHCGPRFTIVRDVPYDRPLTTMAGFPMCPACAAEYHDPADRRFHAQPTCCPACGPRLTLLDSAGQDAAELDSAGQPQDSGSPATPSGGRRSTITSPPGATALEAAAGLLRQGAVVAVKGLGGYHLAADASCEKAVAALRARKHREDKPFAVMAADLDGARRLGVIDDAEAALLTGPARPVVLLARRPDAAVAAATAPGNRRLGVMLPYTPLHHLLLSEVGRPVVLTSGNVS